jgi:hypothetical protein
MLGIVKRGILYYVFYFIMAAWGPAYLLYLDGINPGLVLMIALTGLMTVAYAVASIEVIENQFNGYGFLKTLPIKCETILLAKTLPPIIYLLIWMVYGLILISLGNPSHDFTVLSRAFIILSTSGSIIFILIMYIAIFRIGIRGFMKFAVWGLPMAFMYGLLLLFISLKKQLYALDMERLVDIASISNLTVFCTVSFVIVVVLWRIVLKCFIMRDFK